MLRGTLFTVLVLGISLPAFARLEEGDEKKAAELLAQKLMKSTQDLDLKEKSYKESTGGAGGKQVNANDGNSFTSNTTYHSNVWEYCLKWAGRVCESWLYPYLSLHGKEKDRSPAEGEVYAAANVGSGDSKSQLQIWDFEANGDLLKSDGTLDREAITKWKLNDDVQNKMKKIGTETASRQINRVIDDKDKSNAKGTAIGVSPEALRMMAGRWTKMLRNRLASTAGEIMAMKPGIEMPKNEEMADCKASLNELRRNMDQQRLEERLDPQNNLQIETRMKQLEDRYKLCQQAEKMNFYTVNAKVNGDKIEGSSPEGEWADAALIRANLLAVDFAGVDPREAKIDGRFGLSDEDVKGERTDYNVGATEKKNIKEANWDTIKSYNRALDSAAVGYQEAAARTPFVADRSKQIAQHKIGKGEMNLVKLNDMTPAQKKSLSGTSYQRSTASVDAGDQLEETPSQLIFRDK